MNLQLLDPFNAYLPQTIETSFALPEQKTRVCAYSPSGAWLATGSCHGQCAVWDMETAAILTLMPPPPDIFAGKDSAAAKRALISPVECLAWSRSGKTLLIGLESSIILEWHLLTQSFPRHYNLTTATLRQTVLALSYHPSSENTWVVCTRESGLLLLHHTHSSDQPQLLHVTLPNTTASQEDAAQPPALAGISAAAIDLASRLVYTGDQKGTISLYDLCDLPPASGETQGHPPSPSTASQEQPGHPHAKLFRTFEDACGSGVPLTNSIQRIACHSRKPGNLLLILRDRTIRSFCLNEERTRFIPRFKFQDAVNRWSWRTCTFSHDGEFIVAGAIANGAHLIYIWDGNTGSLIKMLEGPQKDLSDVVWHPRKPMIVSITAFGMALRWAPEYPRKWSALVPGLVEIEENIEYVEREDEFDLTVEEEEAAKKRQHAILDESVPIDVYGGDDIFVEEDMKLFVPYDL